MSKRIICSLLAVFMLAALLCGCGTSSDTTPQVTDEAPAAPDSQVPEADEQEPAAPEEEEPSSYFPLEEEEELSIFMSFIPPVVAQIGEDPMTYTVWSEMSSRLNVDIIFQPTTHDVFREKTMLILSGGDYPDIMMNLLEQAYSFSGDRALEDETVLDLTDYVDEYMPNYAKYFYSNDNYIKDASTDEGKIAAIYCLWNDEVGADYGPVIRQDWLNDLEMSAPVTYDDYHEVLTAFKTEKNAAGALWFSKEGGIGCNYLASGFGTTVGIGQSYSDYYKVVDGKAIFCPLEDGFHDYIETMHQWYSEGLIVPNFYDADYDRSNVDDELITTDSTGIWYIYNEYYNGYYDAISEDPDFAISAIQDAVKSEAEGGHLTSKVNVVSTNHACVTKDCRNVELACRFLDYIYSDDGMLLFNYGVEGEGLEYSAEGNPILSDLIINNPDGLSTTAALTKYAQQQGVMLADVDRFSVIYNKEDLEPWNVTDNEWSFPSMASATSEESTTIMNIMSDLFTYMNENVIKFIVGDRSMDEWDSFISGLDTFDIATATQTIQTIYDRYQSR